MAIQLYRRLLAGISRHCLALALRRGLKPDEAIYIARFPSIVPFQLVSFPRKRESTTTKTARPVIATGSDR